MTVEIDSKSRKSCRGLWTATSDRWCQSMIRSLASSQAEEQQMQFLLSGSCKRSILLPTRDYMSFIGLRSSASEGHLVGAEKTWCRGVDCATGAGDVYQCGEPCQCWVQ